MSQLPLALDASPPSSTRLLAWPRIRLWIAVTLLWAVFRTLCVGAHPELTRCARSILTHP